MPSSPAAILGVTHATISASLLDNFFVTNHLESICYVRGADVQRLLRPDDSDATWHDGGGVSQVRLDILAFQT
jgi:hypothetical protein